MADREQRRLSDLATWPKGLIWGVLLAGSLVIGALLELLHLPAALLLGPMATAIMMAISGADIRMPKLVFTGAQSLVGVMIASTMPASIFGELAAQWPVFVGGVLATAVAAACLGYLMVRAQIFPGTTAIWGSSPGAASVMVVMSESYGGDMRLVAFMQYLRVVCCALAATLAARLFGVTPGEAAAIDWFPAIPLLPTLATLAAAFVATWIGVLIRMPGAALLAPMFACMALKFTFGMPLVLPPWLLALSYAVIGWTVGGRFTRQVIAHAARNFFRVLASVLCLIGICCVFAVALVLLADVDPLTAYLATSPGGADSVAIIAASTKVDVPFVMAMQIARFLFVVITGPATARLLASRTIRA